MIFAKVDVRLRDHIKAQRAGVAMATWTWALLYTREQETDGEIPKEALRVSWAGETVALEHAERLVAVGLWEPTPDGWRIFRYAEKNETKEAISTRRKETRDRVTAHRQKNQNSTPPPATSGNALQTPVTPVLVTEGTALAVPGSGSGSDSDLKSQMKEQETGLPREVRPLWFDAACDTVEMAHPGEKLDRASAWLRYDGHRSAPGSKPMSQKDAQYWLTSVDIKDSRKAREEARVRADRDAKFDREREKTRAEPRSGIVVAPQPYHRPAVAPGPENRASNAEAKAAMKKLTETMFKVGKG